MNSFVHILMISLITSLASLTAQATEVSQAPQNELRSILSSRSLDELHSRETQENETRRAASDCAAELSARALPRSCFLKIKLQHLSDVSAALDRERIDRICRETASRSQSRLDLSGSTELITEGCRAVITKRIEDLRYTDEESHPELSASRTLGPDLED